MERDLLASYFTLAGDVGLDRPRISPVPFATRLDAAAKAGFKGFGFSHDDLVDLVARHGYPSLRRELADASMNWIEVECLMDWYGEGPLRAASDEARTFLLNAAAELGAWHVKISTLPHCPGEESVLIDAFGTLCDEAAACGTRISLEATPFGVVPDVTMALRIVEGANRPNGGLLLDIWHIVRGGTPFSTIAALPPERVFAVELDDADAQPVGNLLHDTSRRRRFCGEGAFDIPGFIEAVDAIGYAGPLGIELLSDEVRAMSAEAAADRAFRTARSSLADRRFRTVTA